MLISPDLLLCKPQNVPHFIGARATEYSRHYCDDLCRQLLSLHCVEIHCVLQYKTRPNWAGFYSKWWRKLSDTPKIALK